LITSEPIYYLGKSFHQSLLSLQSTFFLIGKFGDITYRNICSAIAAKAAGVVGAHQCPPVPRWGPLLSPGGGTRRRGGDGGGKLVPTLDGNAAGPD